MGMDAVPKVSLISPVYNTPESCFWRMVDSVLAQTSSDFELVLVDDGSEPSCSQRCDDAAAKDDRIRVVHQPNAGFAGAMNTGIDAARGDFIMFIDPDDEVAPVMIEHALAVQDETGSDIVCGTQVRRFPSGDMLDGFDLAEGEVRTMTADEVRDYWVFCLTSFIPVGSPSWFGGGLGRGHVTKLIRTSLFDGLRLEPAMCAGSDSLMVAELLRKTSKVSVINEVWYVYYMNSFSVTHTYSFEKNKKEFAAMELQRAAYGDEYYAAGFSRLLDTATRVSASGFRAFRALASYLDEPFAHEIYRRFEARRYQLSRSRRVAAWLGRHRSGWAIAFLYCLKSTLSSKNNEAFSQ